MTRVERAVSPVIGVTLLVGLLVLLVALVAGMLTGFTDELVAPAPQMTFEAEYVPSGEGNTNNRPYVNITWEHGDVGDGESIVIRDDAGNSVEWSEVWTAGSVVGPGEYVHIDGFGSDSELEPICEAGQTYTIVKRTGDGTSFVIERYEVPSDPTPVPSWC